MDEKGYYLVNEDAIFNMIMVGGEFDEFEEFEEGNLEFIPIEDVRNTNYTGSLLLYVEELGLTNLDEYLIDGKLPDSLIVINCSNNNLRELPDLPAELIHLNCSDNKLTELPESIENCSSLQSLSCNNNELKTLRIPLSFVEEFDNWKSHGDEEDVSLVYLNCSFNQLTELPNDIPTGDGELMNKLPNCLENLFCNNNLLTSLPELLPMSLKHLNCSFNTLTSIPILVNNPISPEGTMNILFLHCNNNEITQLPELPNNIKLLNCNNNEITQLPELPNNIKFLNCSKNKLTTLPKLPDDLTTFRCQGNEYDDESMIIIIDFCTKALKNPRKYNQINPTIKELFKYYTSNREHRAQVFREPFTETAGEFAEESGKTIQKEDEAPFRPKPIPEGSIIDILEYANLPTPPPSRKNVGGKKNRKSKTKKNKNTKQITKRKKLNATKKTRRNKN
jgi:Leucine-rich repeat (LRR) protein